MIDFYRHPIFVDWLVSNLIDNDRLLSTIEIIDMLRPVVIKPSYLLILLVDIGKALPTIYLV